MVGEKEVVLKPMTLAEMDKFQVSKPKVIEGKDLEAKNPGTSCLASNIGNAELNIDASDQGKLEVMQQDLKEIEAVDEVVEFEKETYQNYKEDTYLWEDDDDRYSVEKIPLYDSAEDEPSSKLLKSMNSSSSEYNVDVKNKYSMTMNVSVGSEHQFESTALGVQPPDPVPMEDVAVSEIKTEAIEEIKLYSEDTQQAFSQKNAMISRIRSNSACRNYHIGPGSLSNKRSKQYPNGRLKHSSQKQVDAKLVALLLVSKEAKEEILRSEEIKDDANSGLDSLYNEIRPAIEEYERDNQDSVATSVAEKWIEASCLKLKADFDFHFSIVKGFACNRQSSEARPAQGDNENGIKYLTN
ncbi:hypothetical protein CMV_005673 [Castanea mollissima]|uniref:Uncharacterized protein n=1 Tax=Castanea mollissima TaxID=60419 RepID=A0A8J4RJC4_9ROSI|nr:hypothetical protein CMV_005673 [Castanea mollissima]